MMEIEPPRRSASPEFEFWMVGNIHPELEPSGLLTADELFVDGVLLPLHLLSIPPDPNPEHKPAVRFGPGPPEPSKDDQETPVSAAAPSPAASLCQEASITSATSGSLTSSRRWKDMFRVGEKKKESAEEKEEKKKERKASNGGGSGSGGTAELNINIWPFSRSRSAGTTAGGRPKAAMRKSSSAPCSRSNSRGENSGGRRWAASPGRPGIGVHVGRASPVWQVRRAAKVGRPNGGNRGLGLNVNSCIGYRNQVSCRGEECDGGGDERAGNNANGSLFKFRALFSKKVY